MYVCVQLHVDGDDYVEASPELTEQALLAQWFGRTIDDADEPGYITSLSPLLQLSATTYEFSAYLSPEVEREAHLLWLQRDMTAWEEKSAVRRKHRSREKHNWIVRRAKKRANLDALKSLADRLHGFRLGKARCVRTDVRLKRKLPPHVAFCPR